MFEEVGVSKVSASVRKLVYGLGINDAWYVVGRKVDGKSVKCPFYVRWASMLKRAYCNDLHKRNPTYKDVTVCDEWHTFSTFKAWMEGQDWEGKALDKDLLVQGNKEYGPDTCCFVPTALNNLLLTSEARTGAHPLGVSLSAAGRYVATCKADGKTSYLGTFSTPEEASWAYREFKAKLIRGVAESLLDERVKEGLVRRAINLESAECL